MHIRYSATRVSALQVPTSKSQHGVYMLQMDLSTFVPQELSNVIWAYGNMQYQQNPELLQRAAQEMLRRGISQFSPQAISNVCWAFAKHDLICDEFLEVLYVNPHPAMFGGSLCTFVAEMRCSTVFIALDLCHRLMCCLIVWIACLPQGIA